MHFICQDDDLPALCQLVSLIDTSEHLTFLTNSRKRLPASTQGEHFGMPLRKVGFCSSQWLNDKRLHRSKYNHVFVVFTWTMTRWKKYQPLAPPPPPPPFLLSPTLLSHTHFQQTYRSGNIIIHTQKSPLCNIYIHSDHLITFDDWILAKITNFDGESLLHSHRWCILVTMVWWCNRWGRT